MFRRCRGIGRSIRAKLRRVLTMPQEMSREGRVTTNDPNLRARKKLVLRPLPVAIRLDVSLPIGPPGGTPATRLYWIVTGPSRDPERVLSTLLLLN
jgi:hypothetical protein